MGGFMRRVSPALAFLVAVIGIATFSCLDAVMKGLVIKIGAFTTIFWRNLAGVLASGAIYAFKRTPLPSRAAFKLHLTRGAVSTVMSFAFFWGLARIPMAQAVAITFIAPLLSLFLSSVLLGERITSKAIVASAIAFVGVVIILMGQSRAALGESGFWGTAAVFFSAICYAFNIVLMRKQALKSGPIEVAFWQSAVVAVFVGLGAPFFAEMPPLDQVPLIILAALLAVISLLLLAWAYARGKASYLSTSEYTAFIWAAGFGWLLFNEVVSLATLSGAALIVAGCILAAGSEPIPPIEAA
jgi:S-adenosylmethionine uptake transporter